ncbi:flavin-containing amine oxidase [Aspergillus pseudonomiae]|nr:flavin-containing amine oxidase [Aspergillus pseudonomiae]
MPRSREGFLWTPARTIDGLETDAAITTQTKHLQSEYDVVIIGAGFSGLTAARELTRNKNKGELKVLLVEARDRIGGRTWTAKALGEEFEMGGTWVHWNQPHVYSEIHRYDLHRHLKSSAGTLAAQKQYYRSATGNHTVEEIFPELTVASMEHVAAEFFKVDGGDSRQLMPYPHDPFREPTPWKKYDHLTLRQRLDQLGKISEREKEIFESHINTLGSCPGTDTGFVEFLRWFALGGHSFAGMFELAGIYKLGNGGMTGLATSVFHDTGADVLLECAVSEIRQDLAGVSLRTKDGRIIKNENWNCLSDITFQPPLSPLKQEAIRAGHINKGAKIHFRLKETEPGLFATCSSSGHSPFVFAFSDHNGTRRDRGADGTWCIGFSYSGYLTDKRDSNHIVNQFCTNVRPGANVEAYLTHDWMNDPFAKGTWSCWGPSHMAKYVQELQRPHGRVVFASPDWADGWQGFIDGAIEQGIVASRTVQRRLDGEGCQNAQARL